jgi:N6-L-threonylcarbamoyladenine synthase
VILALETSCDDTCAAVLTHDGTIRSNVVSSQHVHDRFGGVVPEIASRHHLELVNVATAKALAAARGLPLAPVDHLQGHVAANFVAPEAFEPPFLCLIASGGHTLLARAGDHRGYETLGTTLDDAGGEAFDKGARLLGLGYPGGPALSKLALDGDPDAFAFPAGERMGGLDFSFAGLKTALLYAVRDLGEEETRRRAADLAASYEHAIVEALMIRMRRAVRETGLERLAVGGGVAANRLLRERVGELGVEVHVPPPALCTDNAAMIASAARWVEPVAHPHYLALDAYATKKRRG